MSTIIEILRGYHNPFLNNAVAGPYDPVVLPCVEKYVELPKKHIADAIDAYLQNRLSNPLIGIHGNTGSGKSFLLQLLTRQSHEKKSHFWVQVQPTDLLQADVSTEAVAKVLWSAILAACEMGCLPGFGPARPLDFYGYKICKKILSDHTESLVMGTRWLGLVTDYLPQQALDVLKNATFAPSLLHQLSPANNAKICRAFCDKISRWTTPAYPAMACWLMAKAFDVPEFCRQCESQLPQDCLSKVAAFTGLAGQLGMPLLLVLDQFEDLFMIPGKHEEHFQNVVMRLQDFMRKTKQMGSGSPLFLLAIVNDPTWTIHLHVWDRGSFLPHGKKWIDLSNGVASFDLAMEFTKAYLQNYAKMVEEKAKSEEKSEVAYLSKDPLYPFTDKILQLLHRDMVGNAERPPEIRNWLNVCQSAWDRLMFRPYPDSLADRRKELLKELRDKVKETNPLPPPPIDWLPLDQPFIQSVFRCHSKIAVNDLCYIRLLQDLLQGLAHLAGAAQAIGRPELIQNNADDKEYLKFFLGQELCLAAFGWRSNKGGGIANEWERLQAFVKKSSETYSQVLLLRTTAESFPGSVPDRCGSARLLKINLLQNDWNGIYAILALGQKQYQPQSDISLLQMPPWFDVNQDYPELIQKLIAETEFLKKIFTAV